MLFNKYSETKQRFGIRKFSIGATSVLLSTLFLTVSGNHKVHAATDNKLVVNTSEKANKDNENITASAEDSSVSPKTDDRNNAD